MCVFEEVTVHRKIFRWMYGTLKHGNAWERGKYKKMNCLLVMKLYINNYYCHLLCYKLPEWCIYFICPAGDCDFEKGMCTWVNSPNIVEDEFDWTRGSGATPSNFTGPATDHTTGTTKGYHFLHIFFLSPFITSLFVLP